ncbi:hypothetical protein CEXT_798491 [Caerostris extrusa]|uniref:Uncharacterized protein n=1 Tax=Caerostris extrusa TaxID=172846 RepID=A0AAV4WW86_CAEEX|nr:hypothetical protein CEXT_798491 [Caerostris extrusa]
MSIADSNFLHGFQQTFDQKECTDETECFNILKAPSQMQCSGIFRTNEVSSHFPSTYNNFDLSGHMLTNDTSQYSRRSLETQILNIEKSTI